MSERTSGLFDLLNDAIGTPQRGVVNFSALHALLHAVLRQLDARDTPARDSPTRGSPARDTPWRDPDPEGDGALNQDHPGERELKVEPGQELQQRIASSPSPPEPTSSSGPAEGDQLTRIRTCEDGVSKAMRLIEELHEQRVHLKEEVKEPRHQQKVEADPSQVQKCSLRVDALEDTVRSLRDTFLKYPDPEALTHCVTWDDLQTTLLGQREKEPEELAHSAASTPFNRASHTSTPPPHAVPAAPRGFPTDGPPQRTPLRAGLTRNASISERHAEVLEALRGVGQLEARVAALEGGKADRAQLTQLTERVNTSSRASDDVLDHLNQQRALISGLMGDRQKLDSLEDMLMNLNMQDKDSSSVSSDSTAASELRQQVSFLRKSVKKLEEDVKQLEAKQAVYVERRTDRGLQDQLDDLRGALEDAVQSITSQPAGSQSSEDRKLLQQQEVVSGLLQRAGGHSENGVLGSEVQKVILQLQAECEKLHEGMSILHEDSRRKQSHLEELLRTTDQLEEKKADKQMVESGIKADKGALESKVSRRQFDSATEELNTMFHELLSKVTGQEQEWNKVVDRLSTQMECKLNRMELDSVKKQLEDRWKNIHQKLQVEESPEQEDAAGIKRQLVARFHCLSCDRPVVMHSPPLNVSSSVGSPSHQPVRPFTVYTQEQFRHHCRSQRVSEGTECSRLSVPRSCGGSHTLTSAKELRSILQPGKQHVQSEEVDIIGLDGHVYKGRLNTASRNPETKLPTIFTKDGKTKDKAKCSLPLKRSSSPELPPPLSVRSAVCSRSEAPPTSVLLLRLTFSEDPQSSSSSRRHEDSGPRCSDAWNVLSTRPITAVFEGEMRCHGNAA
ncbi:glutamine-rich protein 2 isoform X2 [Pungitius pungitius]|uniref:glutamine-rich protein 2 isoform X2 n=1 Tax=Pungitius pungitius TaxID=134920 RepID=UPI002E12D9F1